MKNDQPNELAYLPVSDARKIMGEDADVMTDEDIELAVYNLTSIARAYLRSVLK
jgi:hypothetical protein